MPERAENEIRRRADAIRTPRVLVVLAVVCVVVPVVMMVENTDMKIRGLHREAEELRAENGLLGRKVDAERRRTAAVRAELARVTSHRDDLVAKVEAGRVRETALHQMVGKLREDVGAAQAETRLMAAAWQRNARQMKEMVVNSEETAYVLLQENRELKASLGVDRGSVAELLGEVSSLNSELAYLKDERDEMNREILRVGAQLRAIETPAEAGLIQAVSARP